jgi:hypothetical protein
MTARALTLGEVKAHFRQLVKAAGGVEACGIELGVSHQWISELQNPNKPEALPTFMQIMALEVVAKQDIVTGAASRAIKGQATDDIADAAVAAVAASADVLRLVHDMDRDGKRDHGEIRAVQRATQENARGALELADVAARLTPKVAS